MEGVFLLAQSAPVSKGIPYTIGAWIPFVVVISILVLAVCALVKLVKQYNELHMRTLKHMDATEAKNDEMIGLLKEIRDKAR